MKMENKITDQMLNLDVTVYGAQERLTETLSKSRVRIFYKGLNRNRTFISESFAAELISSLPYAPIKGIFDKDTMDYEDHGELNSDGRIYGIIPENPNFRWERFTDLDGVEREYACADVILFTALYPEANLISGKSQSMEIHRSGLTGEWKICQEDQMPYYEFLHGHLLGLQVLGEETEPCFEGAAFYSLVQSTEELLHYIKNSVEKGDEIKAMDKNVFKLADDHKVGLLYDAINTSETDCNIIVDVHCEYVVYFDTTEQTFKRADYTFDSEKDSVAITTTESCIMEFASTEKSEVEVEDTFAAEVEALKAENESLKAQLEAFAKSDEKKEDDEESEEDESKPEEKEDEDDAEDKKKEAEKEKNALIQSYEEKISEKDAEISRLNQLNSDITNEKTQLEEFKKSVDTDKKLAILEEFASYLTEEQSNSYKEKMDDFTVENFKKEVCTAAYDADPSMFSKKDSDDLVYKITEDKTNETGALKLLNKHRKGGNK